LTRLHRLCIKWLAYSGCQKNVPLLERFLLQPLILPFRISEFIFEKLDIRVGTITSVSEVAKSNKLMKLTVDFGDHTRSILAEIKKERANPQEIEAKQALFVMNLPEKKMAGEVSQGILFDLGYTDNITPCLAVPETPMPNGSRAG